MRCCKSRYYSDLQLAGTSKNFLKGSFSRFPRSNFCTNAKGYWTETNSERYKGEDCFTYKNDYAYLLNTIDKPKIMQNLLTFAKSKNIIGLGRWGEWEHYNSDVTVQRTLELSSFLTA